jgi:hypothetical protein
LLGIGKRDIGVDAAEDTTRVREMLEGHGGGIGLSQKKGGGAASAGGGHARGHGGGGRGGSHSGASKAGAMYVVVWMVFVACIYVMT